MVAELWLTQWKDNSLVESGHMEWVEFKKDVSRKYFLHKKREVKVEKFINLTQGKMSVEEYFLKYTLLSKYAPSLVSNTRVEMSRFLTVFLIL